MKPLHILLVLVLVLPFINVLAQSKPKVIVIGIDGLRPDALAAADTPNLDALIANGLYSPDALNDDITVSGPGWSAMLCGVWSDKHGVENNFFLNSDYDTYPPIFRRLEEYNSELHTASICHWSPINAFITQDHADYKATFGSDEEVAEDAASYLSNEDPDFLFLHFDDVDHEGHAFGFSPDVPNYINGIEGVDNLIGPILSSIENRPGYDEEDWLILVSTDHGGIGTSHGGSSIEEQRIFVIASGNSIPVSTLNSTEVYDENTGEYIEDFSATPRIVDIPVTAMAHLCVPIDPGWSLDGEVLVETCGATSIGAQADNPTDWLLWPNPCTDKLNLQTDTKDQLHAYQVFDAQGQEFLKKQSSDLLQDRWIDVSALSPGTYFLKLNLKRELHKYTFVKQ